MMQPFVNKAPSVRAGVLRIANPRTRYGIRAVHAGAHLAAGPVGRAISAASGRGLANIAAGDLPLPDYRDPVAF